MDRVNIDGTWRNTDNIYFSSAGAWKPIEEVKVNVDGVWRVNFALGGVYWNLRSTAADILNWASTAVCYGNGLFVITPLNSSDIALTSPDGINWTPRTLPERANWYSVCYGNGLFVAVSDGPSSLTSRRVMTSPDGINWTTRTCPVGSWRSICYGNGLFVAVGRGISVPGEVMTSPDGINWTSRTPATSISWVSVAYGAGRFVAVSPTATTTSVMTSTDGVTWTSSTTPSLGWLSICYGDDDFNGPGTGRFVAVSTGTGGSSNRVMVSMNGGTAWFTRSSAQVPAGSWTAVAYGNGMYVAVAKQTTANKIMTSFDTINWATKSNSASTNEWAGVCYANEAFVAVAQTAAANTGKITSSLKVKGEIL